MPEPTETIRMFTGFTVLTLVFLAACIILVVSNRTVDRRARNVFLVSFVALIFIVAMDWFTYLTSGQYPDLRGVHAVAMAVTFAIAPTIPVAIAYVIFPDTSVRLIMIILVAHAVVELASIFGGFVFWIDESNTYHRGSLYVVYMAAYTLSALYLVVESIRAGHTYQSASVVAVVAILACLATGVLIQVRDTHMRTTWTAVAMTVMLYFLFYSDLVLRSDALTKLLNRRSFEEFLAKPTLPYVVVVVDVDNFKHANDTYGHAFGDVCLMRIAGLIRKVFGSAGYCYRTGGDEFVVVITKRVNDVDVLVGQMRKAVEQAQSEEARLPGVSMGCAFAEEGCLSLAEVLEEADRAMYESKRERKVPMR